MNAINSNQKNLLSLFQCHLKIESSFAKKNFKKYIYNIDLIEKKKMNIGQNNLKKYFKHILCIRLWNLLNGINIFLMSC